MLTVVNDVNEKYFSLYNISFQLNAVQLFFMTSNLLATDALFNKCNNL